MADELPALIWSRPEWQRASEAWIAQALAGRGMAQTGPVETILERSWSTIRRVPVEGGAVYFKASIPLLAGEAALLQALHNWRPDVTLPLIAADFERGWMLLPDGGPMLRASLKSEDDLAHAEPLMALMAGLQIDMTAHTGELLALVPFDRRLDRLPDQFEALLDDRSAFNIDQEDGMSGDAYRRLRALAPRFRAMCAELASYNVPHSLHHDDFHDGNVFVDNGRYRIADWAESCVTHPFFSMLVCLRALADRAGYPDEATDVPEEMYPSLARLRDLYLAPWERYEPRETLLRIFNLAWRVGMVNRALTWKAVAEAVDPAYRASQIYAVPAWLGEFLTLMERGA